MQGFNFTVDGSKATEFGVLPDGDYEVFITGTKHTVSQKGTDGLQMVLTVRNDVDQQGGGRKVWHTVWVNDRTVGIVQSFLKAVGVPDGTDLSGANAQEVCEKIQSVVAGKAVRVQLGVQRDNADFNEVKRFKESLIGGVYVKEEEPSGVEIVDPFHGEPIDISDDDLPF